MDALKDALKEEIAEDKKQQLPNIKETRVIEKVAEALKLDELPQDYVKQVFDEIAQDFLGQLQRQGLTLDAWLSARKIQISDFLDDLNAQAAERAVSPWPSTPSPRSSTSRSPRRTSARSSRTPA